MRKLLPFTTFLALLAFIVACGKLNEKFGRQLDKNYSQVRFSSPDHFYSMADVDKGVMIYFVDQVNNSHGKVFGFQNQNIAMSATVTVPNGVYKIYSFGFSAGSDFGDGQTKCGWGNNGATITLNGTSTDISITLNDTNCSFGSDSDFSKQLNSNDPSNTNFDDLRIHLCTNSPSSCTIATTGSYYTKVTLLGGDKINQDVFSENAASSLTTNNCATFSSGVVTTAFNAPIGGPTYSPPINIAIYGDASCSSSLLKNYRLVNGIRDFINSSTTTNNPFLYMQATTSTTSLYLYKDF